MATMGATLRINAQPERVYEAVTDLAGAAERINAIKSLEVLTEGPFGVGTRFRETRVMFGKEATEEMEISAVTPGVCYTTEAESCGSHYTCEVRVTPDGDGCTLSMTMDTKPMTFIAKVMAVVMTPVMGRVVKKMFAKDLEDIKAAVESA